MGASIKFILVFIYWEKRSIIRRVSAFNGGIRRCGFVAGQVLSVENTLPALECERQLGWRIQFLSGILQMWDSLTRI